MRRDHVELDAPSIGGAGVVIAYGQWGRPVLLFPAERGRAWDLENQGMIGAVADLNWSSTPSGQSLARARKNRGPVSSFETIRALRGSVSFDGDKDVGGSRLTLRWL